MTKQSKRIDALVLALLVIVTAIPMNAVTAEAAAKKQPTKATKITASPSSVSVQAKKNSKAVTLKLSKRADKKVTINVKSLDKTTAKVTKSTVTVKKGQKVSSAFKVKGVKKGTAQILVYFTNSDGKKVSKTITVKVKKASTTDESTTDHTKRAEYAEVESLLFDADPTKDGTAATGTISYQDDASVDFGILTATSSDKNIATITGPVGNKFTVAAGTNTGTARVTITYTGTYYVGEITYTVTVVGEGENKVVESITDEDYYFDTMEIEEIGT